VRKLPVPCHKTENPRSVQNAVLTALNFLFAFVAKIVVMVNANAPVARKNLDLFIKDS
jgi:hypothetical protein